MSHSGRARSWPQRSITAAMGSEHSGDRRATAVLWFVARLIPSSSRAHLHAGVHPAMGAAVTGRPPAEAPLWRGPVEAWTVPGPGLPSAQAPFFYLLGWFPQPPWRVGDNPEQRHQVQSSPGLRGGASEQGLSPGGLPARAPLALHPSSVAGVGCSRECLWQRPCCDSLWAP